MQTVRPANARLLRKEYVMCEETAEDRLLQEVKTIEGDRTGWTQHMNYEVA
jgi:hypothetical protein